MTDLAILRSAFDLPGDINGDGFVGAGDLDILLANWNQSVTPGLIGLGDVNRDGLIGAGDLDIVLGNWNQRISETDSASAVPEPASALLLTAGGAAALIRRRDRRPA